MPPPPHPLASNAPEKTPSVLVFENLSGRGESREEEEVGRESCQERGGGHGLADFASTWQVLRRDGAEEARICQWMPETTIGPNPTYTRSVL